MMQRANSRIAQTVMMAIIMVMIGLGLAIAGAATQALGAQNIPSPRPKPAIIASANVKATPDSQTKPTTAPPVKPAKTTKQAKSGVPLPKRRPGNLDYSPFADKKSYKAFSRAMALGARGDFAKARAAFATGNDQLSKQVLQWMFVRTLGAGASFDQVIKFIDQNPSWPGLRAARKNAEFLLFQGRAEDGEIVKHFARFPPITKLGRIALASANQNLGNRAKAKKLFRQVWTQDPLAASTERLLQSRCRGCFSRALDQKRLDAMLYLAQRGPALRAARRLGTGYTKLAQARIAIARRSKRAGRAWARVPQDKKSNVGLTLSRVTWLRRKGRKDQALKLLRTISGTADTVLYPAKWWTERRLVARGALGEGKAIKGAYAISADHGLSHGGKFADAEFLAGWIALTRLKDPKLALPHFQRLEAAVTSPISTARANYWLARTHMATGDVDTARHHFVAAAEHSATYYGQLARAQLGGTLTLLDLPATPKPTTQAKNTFDARPLVIAARRLAAVGQIKLASRFISKLAQTLKSPSQLGLLAQFADQLALGNVAVYVGKRAVRNGAPLYSASYPVGMFVDMKLASQDAAKPAVELAMLYGIARQESEFNWRARSGAGARGLMQIMPATAKEVARDHAYPFALNRLTEDPVYSAQLGNAFLGDLLERFGGSYVLTIAAYNAGAGRVGQWIETFGDPRTRQVDPINWVESIPFDETRNYVQRVLENIQVYRMFLAGRPVPIKLAEDLSRGSVE
ncbi:MAG: lytic transglycosylase domain-containing protein [Alphaproteobacteria bacterium]